MLIDGGLCVRVTNRWPVGRRTLTWRSARSKFTAHSKHGPYATSMIQEGSGPTWCRGRSVFGGVVGERVAVLLDGEFVKRVLGQRLQKFPESADIMGEVARIMRTSCLLGHRLYRVFYYTADPLRSTTRHPLSGQKIEFGATSSFARNSRLIDRVENSPDVAVRRGTLVHQGWQLGRASTKAMLAGTKQSVGAQDIAPRIRQKGVDMRIGLDIASLALKRLVSTIVLVTGDSDFVPAMKLARREGLRVLLDPLGSAQVRPELKIHADRVI